MTVSKPNGNNNGNGWVARTLIMCLWGVGLSAFGSLGLAVDKNDKENVKEHTNIRQEIVLKDMQVRKDIAADIRDIQQSQITLLVQQAEILTELKRKNR